MIAALLFCSATANAAPADNRTLILVVGAAGEAEYGDQFAKWAELWENAAATGGVRCVSIGTGGIDTQDDRTQLLEAMAAESAKTNGELWLVFIGHGTFDGRAAKFNLRGPDVSAEELTTALKSCQRPLAVIDCTAASSPFLKPLSGPGRVVVSATKSGYELNATRFGGYLAKAIADPAADLDKDGQTSLLEAYLMASRQVDQFYKEEGRLATEHALLDDNSDGLGTPPDWFRGARATKTAVDGKSVDGVRAHQFHLVRGTTEQELSPELRLRRDELERQLSDLRLKKDGLKPGEYYVQLERILLEIARLYEKR